MPAAARFAHEMRPGDAYQPLSFSIPAHLNQQFLYAIEDFNPIYLGWGAGKAQIHPMILLHMSARTRSPSFVLAPNMGSVFAREKARFCAPAYVDEMLTTTWRIKEVYEKKERIYQALWIKVLRGQELIVEREMHSVFFASPGPDEKAEAGR